MAEIKNICIYHISMHHYCSSLFVTSRTARLSNKNTPPSSVSRSQCPSHRKRRNTSVFPMQNEQLHTAGGIRTQDPLHARFEPRTLCTLGGCHTSKPRMLALLWVDRDYIYLWRHTNRLRDYAGTLPNNLIDSGKPLIPLIYGLSGLKFITLN